MKCFSLCPLCLFFNKPLCSHEQEACNFVWARQTLLLPPSGCGEFCALIFLRNNSGAIALPFPRAGRWC